MAQPIIIVPPNENDSHSQEDAAVASEAAEVSTEAASISTENAQMAEINSSLSSQAAGESTEAAAVAVAAADTSVTALEGVRAELNALTDRVKLLFDHPPTPGAEEIGNAPVEVSSPPVPDADPAPEEKKPIERKPDARPAQTNWYYKPRGKK